TRPRGAALFETFWVPGVSKGSGRCAGNRLAMRPHRSPGKIMTKTTPASKTLTFRPSKRSDALVDWRDPSHQANVLDWRQRAQDYGLVPVDDQAETLEEDRVPVEPHRLLEEEEPEAFHEQRV